MCPVLERWIEVNKQKHVSPTNSSVIFGIVVKDATAGNVTLLGQERLVIHPSLSCFISVKLRKKNNKLLKLC